jgi:rhodanese-related sulfurtransferase
LDQSAKIVLICRSGNRSAKAADLLSKAGFIQAYSVVDGYEGDIANEGNDKGQRVVNGWKNNGLPWSYQLDKDKLFLP